MNRVLLATVCGLFLTGTCLADSNIPDPVIMCQDRDDEEAPPLDDPNPYSHPYDPDDLPVDEKEELKEPPAFVKEVISAKGNRQPTSRIIFIFDCSSSMGSENRFKKAMAALKSIMQTPIDDMRFMMIGFKEKPFMWEGVKEKGVPKYWAKLPSMIAIEKANKWLDGISCDSYTDISPAILKAFELNKNDEKLTIIIFTDGNNTWSGRATSAPYPGGETPKTVAGKIMAAQKARHAKEKNSDPKKRFGSDSISIFVLGVGKDQNVPMLSAIAKAGYGPYLTEVALYNKSCPACIQQSRKYKVMPGAKAHYMNKQKGMCKPHAEANKKPKKPQPKGK